MSLSHFTSESYSAPERDAVWQQRLSDLGLRSALKSDEPPRHANAILRGDAERIIVGRLAAAPQVLIPAPQADGLPLLLLPLEDDTVIETEGLERTVAPGSLVLLPRQGGWQIAFRRDVQAIVLSVTAAAFGGRKIGLSEASEIRIVPAEGMAGVLAHSLEATAQSLDVMTASEWSAVDQSLAEMLLALVHQRPASASAVTATSSQAGVLHRICQTIERRLADPELTPARVARAEGISERYLQKLFESTGDNFTHYLRERRLHRAWMDLSNPAEAHQSVSEIGYRCGFNDAAHFSRAFRERYGLPPRLFRQRESERSAAARNCRHQRGWPQEALAQLKARRCETVGGADTDLEAAASPATKTPRHHHLSVDAAHVHWGYFSRALKPVIEIASGDTITIETLTQHSSDDPERMILGDPGAESVFGWTRTQKAVDRRGAGPMDASIFGRGAGEGFGVHICTGPVAVQDAQPGDVLEVRILDMVPRGSRNPEFAGRIFGSSAAAWWGYHYAELLTEPRPREAVTVYEIFAEDEAPHARAVYAYRWKPQTDPFGVTHDTYDYPGVLVEPGTVERVHGVLGGIRIPLRPHFGVIGVAPRETDLVDSVPPCYFGGNLDNWRLGRGAAVYLPVSVAGALLSVGDPHAAQGDGELGGTAIECSMTGTFGVVLHKKADLAGRPFADLTYPLIETETDWVLTGLSHPNYLAEFGAKGQSEVYARSSLDLAMKDAFRKVRRFLMHTLHLSEDEAIALTSAAVDFGVTQVVDGNWGVHAILSKQLFARVGAWS
jgi:acetamidase/formamidase/AraC-like DNA-binding protein